MHRNAFQSRAGRAPPAAPPTMRPQHRPPRRPAHRARTRCLPRHRGQMWPRHRETRRYPLWDTFTPSFCMMPCWGWDAGVRADAVTTGCFPGHIWQRVPASAAGGVQQDGSLHFHVNSGNGAGGAVTAAPAIWRWLSTVQPGAAASRRAGVARQQEHIKAPRPPPAPQGPHRARPRQAGEGPPGMNVLRW